MATLTLQAATRTSCSRRFYQGLGIGLTFVPLSSTVALVAVPMRELGHASGLFNFDPHDRRQHRHRGRRHHAAARLPDASVRLAAHMSPYDPDVWDRFQWLTSMFAARGADPATAEQQAWAHLYAVVQKQALALLLSSTTSGGWRGSSSP